MPGTRITARAVAIALSDITANDLLGRVSEAAPSFTVSARIPVGKKRKVEGVILLEEVYRLILRGILSVTATLEGIDFTIELPTLTELIAELERLLDERISRSLTLVTKRHFDERLHAQSTLLQCSTGVVLKQILDAFPHMQTQQIQGLANVGGLSITTEGGSLYELVMAMVVDGLYERFVTIREVEKRFLPPVVISVDGERDLTKVPDFLRPAERPWVNDEPVVGIDFVESDPRYQFYSTLPGYVGMRKTRGFFGQRNYMAYLIRASRMTIAFVDCKLYGNACYAFEAVDDEQRWLQAAYQTKPEVRATQGQGLLVRIIRHSEGWESIVLKVKDSH